MPKLARRDAVAHPAALVLSVRPSARHPPAPAPTALLVGRNRLTQPEGDLRQGRLSWSSVQLRPIPSSRALATAPAPF